MPFLSSSASGPVSLADGLAIARAMAGRIKAQAQGFVASAGTAGILSSQLVGIPADWNSAVTSLNTYAALPGMAAYATAQLGEATVAADFAAMIAAITAVTTWIVANFPADSNGYLQYVQWGTGGNLSYVTFSPAQLTGLVTLLNALIATIT